jgi:hypothetical protein
MLAPPISDESRSVVFTLLYRSHFVFSTVSVCQYATSILSIHDLIEDVYVGPSFILENLSVDRVDCSFDR